VVQLVSGGVRPTTFALLTAAAAGCACGPVLVRCACHAARGRRDRNSRAPREWRVRSAGSTTSRALLKQPDKQVIPKSCPDQPVSKTVPDTPPSDDTHRRTAMHRVSRKSRLAWLFRQAPGRPLEDLHGIVELLLARGADPIEADAELMCPLKRVLALPDLERPPHGYASARKSLSSVSCACLAARPTTTGARHRPRGLLQRRVRRALRHLASTPASRRSRPHLPFARDSDRHYSRLTLRVHDAREVSTTDAELRDWGARQHCRFGKPAPRPGARRRDRRERTSR
jgi:hypothetical protein